MRTRRFSVMSCLVLFFTVLSTAQIRAAELPDDLKVYGVRFAKSGVKEWTRDYGASTPTWTAKADPIVYNLSRSTIVATIPSRASKDTMKVLSVVAAAAFGPEVIKANKKAVSDPLAAMVKALEKQPGTRQKRTIGGKEVTLMQEASNARVVTVAISKT